jgi:putative DNA primase/helicase
MAGEAGYDNVPPARRADPELAAKILEDEREGVLAWMVEGARRLEELGAIPHPEESRVTLEDVRLQADPIATWVEAHCDVHIMARTERAPLLDPWFTSNDALGASYRAWCRVSGEAPMSAKALGMRLERMGLQPAKVRGTRGRRGIRIRVVGGEP